jgi:hypothetical protein
VRYYWYIMGATNIFLRLRSSWGWSSSLILRCWETVWAKPFNGIGWYPKQPIDWPTITTNHKTWFLSEFFFRMMSAILTQPSDCWLRDMTCSFERWYLDTKHIAQMQTEQHIWHIGLSWDDTGQSYSYRHRWKSETQGPANLSFVTNLSYQCEFTILDSL